MTSFTCAICHEERKGRERALGYNSVNSVCSTCYDAGHTSYITRNTARHCEGCNRKINSGPCCYCSRGIKEAVYLVNEA